MLKHLWIKLTRDESCETRNHYPREWGRLVEILTNFERIRRSRAHDATAIHFVRRLYRYPRLPRGQSNIHVQFPVIPHTVTIANEQRDENGNATRL